MELRTAWCTRAWSMALTSTKQTSKPNQRILTAMVSAANSQRDGAGGRRDGLVTRPMQIVRGREGACLPHYRDSPALPLVVRSTAGRGERAARGEGRSAFFA